MPDQSDALVRILLCASHGRQALLVDSAGGRALRGTHFQASMLGNGNVPRALEMQLQVLHFKRGRATMLGQRTAKARDGFDKVIGDFKKKLCCTSEHKAHVLDKKKEEKPQQQKQQCQQARRGTTWRRPFEASRPTRSISSPRPPKHATCQQMNGKKRVYKHPALPCRLFAWGRAARQDLAAWAGSRRTSTGQPFERFPARRD